MAEPTVALSRRRSIAMKDEVTYGVDVFGGTVLAADVLNARNINVSPQVQNFDAMPEAAGFLGRRASIPLVPAIQVTFEIPLRGAGAAYSAVLLPEAGLPFRGCGFLETTDFTPATENVVYTLRSTGREAMTIYVLQENGVSYELVGCFGDWQMTWAVGQPIILACTFTGKVDLFGSVALVTGTPNATLQYPQFKSALFQIGTENFAAKMAQIVLNGGNSIQPQIDQNDLRTVAGFFIDNRDPSGSLDAEVVAPATFDWFDKLEKGELMDMTWQSGPDTQYNRVKVSIPKVQITNIQEGERSGARVFNVSFNLRVDAGNDEISITYD
ncbi:hypothetical protein LCGC14_2152780 [marine sediment metagenome]|uniref:Uncharacterized protein n=1 Tax=marine sediment metagenome TaxID=412755 RepID=A0A0F9EH79_9ZZZZ